MIALDPETGVQRWRFDPTDRPQPPYSDVARRGVSVWEDADPKHREPCSRRIFTGTLDARLLALDAATGQPCEDFGTDGQVDLTTGLRIRDRSHYLVTSPPAIYGECCSRRLRRSATTGPPMSSAA